MDQVKIDTVCLFLMLTALKEQWLFEGKMVDSKIGAETVQEQCVLVLKSKEGLREQWGYVKRTEEPAWRGSHWSSEPVKLPNHVQLFETPWTIASQAPPSMEFSRQAYWSGLPFPSPGDLPDPGFKPRSPALQADALLSELPGNPWSRGSQFRGFKFLASRAARV